MGGNRSGEGRTQLVTQFYETLLLVHREGAKDLCGVIHVIPIHHSVDGASAESAREWIRSAHARGAEVKLNLLILYARRGAFRRKAITWNERRKVTVRKAWAIISGRTNWARHERGPESARLARYETKGKEGDGLD